MSYLKRNLYFITLHSLLIALAGTTMALAWQNRDLELRLNPPPPASPYAAGDVMEPFLAQDPEGREVTVEANAASDQERWLLFFTTTCPACSENQAKWRQLTQRVSDQHEVVGVSLDPLDATLRYRDERDLPYDVVSVPDSNAFAEKTGLHSVPFTLRIGTDGKVRDAWLGVLSDSTLDDLHP